MVSVLLLVLLEGKDSLPSAPPEFEGCSARFSSTGLSGRESTGDGGRSRTEWEEVPGGGESPGQSVDDPYSEELRPREDLRRLVQGRVGHGQEVGDMARGHQRSDPYVLFPR